MFTHLCGAGLALLTFAASLIIGLYVNNPFVTVVKRSLLMMACFYILGCVLSALGQKVITENFNNQLAEKSNNDDAQNNTESAAAAN